MLKKGITFTSNRNDYVILRLNVASGNKVTISNIQLEQGSIATEYETHKSSSTNIDLKGNELCSIGDVKDELIVKDGKASITKKIGKVVLDGSENWIVGLAPNQNNTIYLASNNYDDLSNNKHIISNYFVYISNIWDVDVEGCFYDTERAPKIRLRINKTKASTVAEFKSWLKSQYDAGTPVEVYYQLATPQIIDLGIIEMPYIYDGVTNIFTNDDLEPNINVKYYKNLIGTIKDLRINNNTLKQELENIESRLSALENANTNIVNEEENNI